MNIPKYSVSVSLGKLEGDACANTVDCQTTGTANANSQCSGTGYCECQAGNSADGGGVCSISKFNISHRENHSQAIYGVSLMGCTELIISSR